MKIRRSRCVWVILGMFLFLMLYSGRGYASEAFRIGVLGPMTGPCAETGEGMKGASIIAADEINAAGGILGRQVELFFGDDESKAAAGASVVERLINRDKVDILIGSMNSNVGLATMEVAANYKIPYIMTGPAAEKIAQKIRDNPERYRYLLKPDPSTHAHGVGVADAARFLAELKMPNVNKKTAVLLMEHTDWGKGVEVASEEELKKVGWTVLDKEIHDIAETNFMALLSKVKALNPEILATAETSASAAASLARQFVEQGLQMYLVQVYGALKPGYLEALGEGGDGIIAEIMVHCHTQVCDEFTQKYVTRWGAPKFDVVGAMQYDMMHLAKKAYEKAGSFDKDKWIQAVLDMRVPGTVGVYEFDKASHESKVGKDYIPTVNLQLQNGEFHFILPDYMREVEVMKPSWMK